MYFDALRVKIRDEGLVRNKAVYLAIGMEIIYLTRPALAGIVRRGLPCLRIVRT